MDSYTKFILSVIAGSLFWISLHVGSLVPNAFASYSDTKIDIADVSVSSRRALPVLVSGELICK